MKHKQEDIIMNKTNCTTTALTKGAVSAYDFGGIRLLAYQTKDLMDDEVFILVKDGKGVSIELPCFKDNIAELESYITENNIEMVGKLVAYHAAGGTFLPDVKAYGTKSSVEYNTNGGGAGLIGNFTAAFGDAFDNNVCNTDVIMEDGEIEIGGIKFVIKSNAEAYDIEIPEINCVYTHMMGHDCHSIVAGAPHADGMISQLNYYIRKGFDLVLTSHYTPEDLKDAQTKVAYLNEIKEIALESENADDMRAKVNDKYAGYSGLNYLDMTVGFFFPQK